LEKYVIITGGGSGSRMNASIPKQFLEINGTPILFYSILAFVKYDPSIKIVLTLPESYLEYWEKLITEKDFSHSHKIVTGGNTRFQSIFNALQLVPKDALIAIHDAVRPFVSKEVISKGFKDAEKYGSAIPVIEAIESVRFITNQENKRLNRSEIFLAQTPQIFNSTALLKSYSTPEIADFTDDASVYETCFNTIHTYSGNRENIKITNSIDLAIAEVFANQ
jgi:2-C-methyl-D-erythritol 4-phosphate cytidylyltransferase